MAWKDLESKLPDLFSNVCIALMILNFNMIDVDTPQVRGNKLWTTYR